MANFITNAAAVCMPFSLKVLVYLFTAATKVGARVSSAPRHGCSKDMTKLRYAAASTHTLRDDFGRRSRELAMGRQDLVVAKTRTRLGEGLTASRLTRGLAGAYSGRDSRTIPNTVGS